MQRIWNFVITGGPCSGKTTGLEKLESYFSKKGFKVIKVPEIATSIISSGIPTKDAPIYEFQKGVFDIGMAQEKTTKELAKYLAENYKKDIIIFYDRGLMDGKAYMNPNEFNKILIQEGYTEENIKSGYDAVFHLVTAADGVENFYTVENNKARTEGIKEARELDKKTYEAWLGHGKLYRFDNSTDFDTKIKKLIEKVELEIGILK